MAQRTRLAISSALQSAQCFAISEVEDDWHKLMALHRSLRSSTAHTDE